MEIETGRGNLRGLDRINVLLGKNGCGKSTLLKAAVQTARASRSTWGRVKYVTPERGGTLVYDQSVERNARRDENWLPSVTENNQFASYKQQTLFQFETLEISALRAFKKETLAGSTPRDENFYEMINSLLDNIEIEEQMSPNRGFKILHKGNRTPIEPGQISSGESELISLAIECLAFSFSVATGETGLLAMDEPDVHLHPDLQARLMRFLVEMVEQNPGLTVIMATHSTAILGELSRYDRTTVATMRSGQTELSFEPIDEIYRQVLPVFGAHPLTSVFREVPLLLVEGGDEVRIWQQAVRTSRGNLHLYPVDTGGLGEMPKFEKRAKDVAESIYDDAEFYSLRDRDERTDELQDDAPLVKLMLDCRASENLLLCDEVIASTGTTWEQLKVSIDEWIASSAGHPKLDAMKTFADGGYDRKSADLKDIRNLLVHNMDANKSWEVLVGQAIGNLAVEHLQTTASDSLTDYLGSKVCSVLEKALSAHIRPLSGLPPRASE